MPLTNLLKKDSFAWSTTSQQAFETLKQAMILAPVLALPDLSLPFVLETDASGVAYFSKKMSPRMQNKSAYVRELFAVIEYVNKFCHYLLGHQFIIRTNQQALRYLRQQRIHTPK